MQNAEGKNAGQTQAMSCRFRLFFILHSYLLHSWGGLGVSLVLALGAA